MTTIREATPADVNVIVAMGERFLALTTYRDRLTHNSDQMRGLAARLIAGADSVIYVAEIAGDVVGMIGMLVFVHPMSADITASEVFWWVEPDRRGIGLRLYRVAESWARAHDAAQLQMIAPSPDVEVLYQRLGFVEVETLYQRRLS